MYTSASKATEKTPKYLLSKKLKVSWIGDTKWFLETIFDWFLTPAGGVATPPSHEGFIKNRVDSFALTAANVFPAAMPYHSG